MRLLLGTIAVAYLPGAMFYRLPIGSPARRTALAVEERFFWHVILSVAWSLSIVLLLAALGAYRFNRLILINVVVSVVLAIAGFSRMRLAAARIGWSWTVVLPIALVALGVWRFFPSSEYVIGGRDPGVYVNEGIQISQRGSLVIHDPVVAAVPEAGRDLFFPSHLNPDYYSLRFMGFFIQNPTTGAVVGQFPHLYPASIAVAYDLAGLTGARTAVGVWAVLGVLAMYFAGARLIGPPAAFAAGALLSLNVIQVWFARYPNAEVVMQAMVFAALLAFARAHQDDDAFFGPVAGALAGLLIFLRIDALLAIVAMIVAAALTWLVDWKKPRAGFVIPIALAGFVALFYLKGPLRAYLWRATVYLQNLPVAGLVGGCAAGLMAFVVLLWLRRHFAERGRALVPYGVVAIILLLSAYAWFVRQPGGRLTDYDAFVLRTFTDAYLLRLGLVMALAGFVLVVARGFWRDPAFILVFAAFALFTFYKAQIYPEHFWMGRRFLAVILPGALLFAAAAALGPPMGRLWSWQTVRVIAGVVLLGLLGQRYLIASAPLVEHVEYRGVIPELEKLAAQFADRDLILVESRNAGTDTHVLAVPLAYIYGRNVLVLHSPVPDKLRLHEFLDNARQRYERVFFIGGGGTNLLSRRITASAVADGRIQIPEYETTPWHAYPASVRRKDFDYTVYALSIDAVAPPGPFVLDVGERDDLHVVRFHAKEQTEGRSIRWTGPQSFVALPGLRGDEREVVLVMHDGGRPKNAAPPTVNVFFEDTLLGSVVVSSGFRSHSFPIPADVAQKAAQREDPAQLRLVSTTWRPRDLLGTSDDRALGVMLDRVEVR